MDNSPTSVLQQSKDLFSKKEDDYGESWKLTGKILSMIIQQQGEEEIKVPATPEHLSALGLYTRRLDKIIRSFNGTFMKENMEIDESVEETVRDQVPYAAMQSVVASELADSDDDEVAGENVYCRQCGEPASDSSRMLGSDEYEYYCECGNVWRDL